MEHYGYLPAGSLLARGGALSQRTRHL